MSLPWSFICHFLLDQEWCCLKIPLSGADYTNGPYCLCFFDNSKSELDESLPWLFTYFFFKVYLLIYYWISCNIDGEFSIDHVFICFTFLFSQLSIFPSTSDPVWLGYNLSVTCSLGLSSETWLSWSLSQELRAHSVATLFLVSSVLLGCWWVTQFSADSFLFFLNLHSEWLCWHLWSHNH